MKQVLSDAKKQAINLAKQVGMEAIKVPGEIAHEGYRQITGLSKDEVRQLYGVDGGPNNASSGNELPKEQQLEALRAKMRVFSQRRAQEWQKVEVQTQQAQAQRVDQIVEAGLGHTPEGRPVKEVQKEENKKKGIADRMIEFFKSKRPKGKALLGLGFAKKQSMGEMGKSQQ
jgi:hypothetical protein